MVICHSYGTVYQRVSNGIHWIKTTFFLIQTYLQIMWHNNKPYLSIPIYTYLYLSIPIYTYLYLSIPIYTYLYLIQTRKNMETYQAAHPWRIHSMLIDCSMRVAPLVYQPTSLTSLTSTSMPPTTRISSCSSFMAGRALQIWDLQQTWQASWLAMNHFPK